MKNNKWSIWAVVVLSVLIGVLSTMFYFKVKERRALYDVKYRDWRKLNLILEQVDANYVDTIDTKTLTDVAVEAVLSKLDPHSTYMPPAVREESDNSLAAGFDGIGIQFNVPNDTAIVIESIAGGPAQKSGIIAGDRLLKVDDVNIAGVHYPQDSMVRRMKGPAGTKVNVTVKRDGEVIPFEITRGKIPLHSVDAAFMTSSTEGYVRVSKFSRSTYEEFVKALSSLSAQGMKHLVVDLRDNTGGYFDQALLMSNLFLPKDSLIVFLEGRKRPREDYRADGHGPYQELPVSLLINEGSASSSEIFAGALQDNHRAIVVGGRSFGKGLVQEPINFTDGSGIRLTVARFHTPSGRCIQKPYTDDYQLEVYKRYGEAEMVQKDSMKIEKGGIIPDVFVPLDTTRASDFYIKCNRKACAMRFASDYFDKHHAELSNIDDYAQLLDYLDKAQLEKKFLAFVREKDGLTPTRKEWEESKSYIMTQIRALVGRYSALGDNAFYHIYLAIDDTYAAAVTAR